MWNFFFPCGITWNYKPSATCYSLYLALPTREVSILESYFSSHSSSASFLSWLTFRPLAGFRFAKRVSRSSRHYSHLSHVTPSYSRGVLENNLFQSQDKRKSKIFDTSPQKENFIEFTSQNKRLNVELREKFQLHVWDPFAFCPRGNYLVPGSS